MSDWEIMLAGDWKRIGVLEVQFLEQLQKDSKTVGQITLRGHSYEFDTAALTQRNIATGRSRPLRRAGVMKSFSRSLTMKKVPSQPVRCNVYHVGKSEGILSIRTANGLLSIMGTGAYHAAIEIYDQEWSYGAIDNGPGLFGCPPKECEMHDFYQTVELGTVTHSQEYVDTLLNEMQNDWMGPDYDLLRKNCTHFSNEFATRLGVGPIPGWIMNLAGVGATLEDTVRKGARARMDEQGLPPNMSIQSYHFGDVTRGLVAAGKEARSSPSIPEEQPARAGLTARAGCFLDFARGIAKICCPSKPREIEGKV